MKSFILAHAEILLLLLIFLVVVVASFFLTGLPLSLVVLAALFAMGKLYQNSRYNH